MVNNKLSKMLKPDSKIYLWMIALLVFVLMLYNQFVGALGIALLVYLNYYNWRTNRSHSNKWKKYIEDLSSDIDSAARYAILNLPLPLTLVDMDGKVTWYNSKFLDIMDENDLIGVQIEDLLPALSLEKLVVGESDEEFKVGDRRYRVLSNMVKIEDDQSKLIMMLYWIDVTEESKIRERYEDEQMVIAMVQVDNYDDVLSETKEDKKPFVISEIDTKLGLWASRMNALIKRFNKDKYLIVFEYKYLENLEAKRFSILDEIREIDAGNKIPVTVSIGVGVTGKSYSSQEENAFSALELALGRGGDQVVVRKQGDFEFYGGKTKAVEKRNRVKARIIAHAFRPLIDESSRVIIMGHKYPDMDSYGAAIGIYRAIISRGKDAYMVINDVNEAIRNIHEMFKDKDTYNFITSEEAKALADNNTMLVVVDTHRPSFTECPELLETCRRLVLFDHHRLGTEFIENTALRYLEPYASSTSELVTEILPYMGSKISVEKAEAEALLAGITVDTKNFTYKTGVRTFEAASLLRRYGADSTVVKQLFRDDLSTFIAKSNLVSNAKLYTSDIAISICYDIIPNIQLVAAQAADDLLNIRGINTSFVVGQNEDGIIFVSGRSIGDTNVQLILEKVGGGGHMTVAGAQFKDISLDEAKDRLMKAIEEYFKEGDKK